MRFKKYNFGIPFLVLFCCFFSVDAQESGQSENKLKISMRDSLDYQFDLSDVILSKKGFVPVPMIITEPALGGFGGVLAPVFIQPNPPRNLDGHMIPMPANITAVFGGYTLNDSWAVGAARTGAINKWNMRYAIGGAYLNANMDFYFHPERVDKDVKVGFNIKTIPLFLSVTKQLKDPRFSIGIQYVFLHSELEINSDTESKIQEQIDSIVGDYLSGNVGILGLKLAYDNRDNVFTPNKGLKAYLSANWSNPLVGSDYKYGLAEFANYYYFPLSHNLITGTRFDMQQSFGDQPFYLKPYIDMRGVPTMRYQGKTTVLAELEERWDFKLRWSLMLYGGLGKAFDNYRDFGSSEWAWNYGTGFRYLIARKLNLRMGLDLAMGPEGFTYYIVFGSSWLRQ